MFVIMVVYLLFVNNCIFCVEVVVVFGIYCFVVVGCDGDVDVFGGMNVILEVIFGLVVVIDLWLGLFGYECFFIVVNYLYFNWLFGLE